MTSFRWLFDPASVFEEVVPIGQILHLSVGDYKFTGVDDVDVRVDDEDTLRVMLTYKRVDNEV